MRLPYVAGCHIAFDHHLSETVRNASDIKNHIIDPDAPSAARVVYDYYGGADLLDHGTVAVAQAVPGFGVHHEHDERCLLVPAREIVVLGVMRIRIKSSAKLLSSLFLPTL